MGKGEIEMKGISKKFHHRGKWMIAAILMVMMAFAVPVSAADWPDKVHFLIPGGAGGGWDGTARGKEVPVGTYYYIIIPYSEAKPITGNVTIIR